MKQLVLLTVILSVTAAIAEPKLGTVDMLKLVRNHPNYKPNKTLLMDTEKDYQKKLEKLRQDLDAIQEEGKKLAEQAKNPMIAATAKSKLENDLMNVQNRYLSGQQQLRTEAMRYQQELQDLEGRLLKTTSEDLHKRINEYAKDEEFDLIIDSSAVPYAKESFDVTPAILKAMGVDPAKAESVSNESK